MTWGAVANSETLEDLGRGSEADCGIMDVLGHGVEADSETMEDLGHGAVQNSKTLEDLGHGSEVDCGTVEQETTRTDPEDHGAIAEPAGQEAMAENSTTSSAVQTGEKIPTVEQMTTSVHLVDKNEDEKKLFSMTKTRR